MRNRITQQGMTVWGLLFVLGVLAFFLFLGFKLFPPYMDDFKVKSAMDSLARQPDAGALSKMGLVEALNKRFDIDNVTGIDVNKYLTVEQRGRNKVIRLKYERVIPLMYNASVLLEFDHTREVRAVE